ncbi:ABC transporter permease [Paraburkholderia susongensis]|uniref:Peptide/nickel transport system permease protein n=1 Tax=Paraburkholderia susongensis TaxID=1515439 RepID=A0A1X7LXU5_9BURK|nr:ABC transporter permease [Paraburkholderia susongensis]SMG58113.1 peptide/nickel transport system permease protein [Paraburkholderia susongensis]
MSAQSKGLPGVFFAARRLVSTVLTLLGLVTLVFAMTKAIPGDEAQVAAGPEASPAQVEAVRQRMGLDAPLAVQYGRFVGHVLQGDLGTSISTQQPVLDDVLKVFPSTLELVIVTLLLSLLLAVPVAVAAATWRDSAFDRACRVVAVAAGGMPAFWLALLAQYVLASRWGLLPISGQQSLDFSVPVRTQMPVVDTLLAGDLAAFADAVRHLVLPAISLAAFFAAQFFRTLRASLIAILESDFIVPVRAKGASFARIMLRHALPNAIGPTVTLAGVLLGMMIGSSVLVESVFGRQGVGAYLSNAVEQKDTYAVLGAVLFVGAVVCVSNVLVDLLLLAVDPRIRAAQLHGSKR